MKDLKMIDIQGVMKKPQFTERPRIVCGAAIFRYNPSIANAELLTVFKRKTQRFEFPGGKINSGESIWEATEREALEEIGCRISLLDNTAFTHQFRTETGLKEIYVFKARVRNGEPMIAEEDKFDGTLWMQMKGYSSKHLPIAPYVSQFAYETSAEHIKHFFRK